MSRDLKKCVVADNGKTYCWDNSIKKFVIVTIEEVPIRSIPEDALQELLTEAYKDD